MKITIDNRPIEVDENVTILDAAEKHNIYIPHLCSHPELTSYGGCRLCIVEVDGMRGYPTACTAKVQEGMNIRTHTDIIQEMRREIIQLILSEHPSGCLICEEKEECAGTMETIRKVGVTTGCRWCPKDGDCELQRVVTYLEIDSIKFPVYYQDLEVEKYDPFFDRDYNLCIYCARCVRICAEHRKSFVLGLNERGKDALVGPAFHNSHIEAECEFCGACVSVCPTGALSEKNRKWAGVPSTYEESICPFCSMNCEIQILTKKGKIIGTLPPGDPHQSGGELCVKGRFCLSEMVNHPERLLEPKFRFLEGYGIISWEDAVQKAAEQIKTAKGKRTALFLSPALSLEEIAAVDLFASKVLDTSNITSSVFNENLAPYLSMAEKSVPLEEIENCDAVITICLKENYNYGPVSVAIKRAGEKGVPLCQIGWIRDTASRFSSLDIAPPPGKEKQFFRQLLNTLEKGKGGSADIKRIAKMLEDASCAAIIPGPEITDLTEGRDILESIEKIARIAGARIFAPGRFGNLSGLLSIIDVPFCEGTFDEIAQEKIDLLYIIGDAPFTQRPPVDFIIHQSSFPPPDELKADLILPTTTWGEISGTYADFHGKRKKFKAVVEPPGFALGNLEIFSRIAKETGKEDVKFTEKEIAKRIPARLYIEPPENKNKPRKKPKVSQPDTYFPYLLIQERTPHAFHNVSLSKIIAGMAAIVPENSLMMNPADAAKLGLKDGDSVQVESTGTDKVYPLKIRGFISPGFVFLLTHARSVVFESNPCPVHLRRKNV